MLRLIVAEPNPLLRVGIKAILETRSDIAILAEVADAGQLRSAFLNLSHDVLIVGLGLLTAIGADTLCEWRALRPDSRILVHSYEIDIRFAVDAFKFGVAGYLSNDCSPSDLCNAIVAVAAGQPYITQSLGAAVATYVCFQASNRPYVPLSAREMKVFQMLSIGLNVKSVAMQLGQRVETVHAIKLRIMAKMQLPDASGLVQRAIMQTCRRKHLELTDVCPM